MTVDSAPLLRLAQQLEIPSDDLATAERVERLAGTFNVTSAAVARLTQDDLDDFASAYRDAARLTIGTGPLAQITVESGDYDRGELVALTTEAGATSTTYEVVLEIDKKRLGGFLSGGSEHAIVRAFFFGSVVARHLGRSPTVIERELWSDVNKRLVIAVLDTDVHMTGDWISLVGGSYLNGVHSEAARPIVDDLERMATRRNDYVGWDSTIETSLTPAHFSTEPILAPDWARSRLKVLATGLGAMYLCDRARDVQRSDGQRFTQVEFRGREHVAFVPIDWTADLAGVEDLHVDAVVGVVDWCYEHVPEHRSTDMVGDRLPFVQTRVAQLLENRDEGGRMAAFALTMPAIAEGVKWHWRSFIEGRVNEYLEQVTELERAVDTTVARLSNQTSTLIKRLTETMLAAIAALIGSFVAATFANPFQAELFTIGMLAYAGYVLAFPLTVGTASSIGDARVAEATFAAQRRNLARILGEDRVNEIVNERPQLARKRFRFWVWLVGLLYIIASSAAIVAALRLPSVIDQ